jgi:hypothetical protein
VGEAQKNQHSKTSFVVEKKKPAQQIKTRKSENCLWALFNVGHKTCALR